MNDDFDARLYYDKKKIKGWLGSLLSEDGELKAVEKFNNYGTATEKAIRTYSKCRIYF